MVSLPEMPARVALLPRDPRGYPVPWFVHWEDGVPDLRVIGLGKWADAVRFERCWVCGGQRGRNFSFVIGPMSTINRVSGEPPCHFDCALFAARACPYLTRPKMRRNEKDLPEPVVSRPTPEIMSLDNPGLCAVWSTRAFTVIRGPGGEPLAALGPPSEVLWFRQARAATRDEVLEALYEGQLGLEEQAHKQLAGGDGFTEARVEINNMTAAAKELAPR